MKGFDLEALKGIFKDRKNHIAVGKITKLGVATDRSVLRVQVSIFPENREIIARMTWDHVGPNSGIFAFPAVDDLVLVAMADGDEENCFVIRRMTSKDDKIPLNAVDGHTVIKALAGKETWITSDTRINLSAGDDDPTQPLVLGTELKTLLVSILTELKTVTTAISTHTHIGNMGAPTSPPQEAASFTTSGTAFDNLKASPVQDSVILSDIAFTEKGS